MKLSPKIENTINILVVCSKQHAASFDNIVIKRYISEIVTQINEGRGIGRLRVDLKIISKPEDVGELIYENNALTCMRTLLHTAVLIVKAHVKYKNIAIFE